MTLNASRPYDLPSMFEAFSASAGGAGLWASLSPSAKARVESIPHLPSGVDVLIYCDGACSGNGMENPPGGWGVLMRDAWGISAAFDGERDTTNNKMELSAAIEALAALPKGLNVLIKTDSEYVIKGCTEWRANWQSNGMRTGKKKPVANQELWLMLWEQVDARKVKFEWVRGHSGDPGNELADALSVMGAQQARRSPSAQDRPGARP